MIALPVTYEPIATNTLGSNTTDITFSSIAGTFTDLVLVANFVGFTTLGSAISCRFNSDTGNNYSATYLLGNGTTASSARATNDNRMIVGGTQNGVGSGNAVCIVNIMNYSNTTTNKTVVSRFSQAGSQVESDVGLWRSTSAITSITFGAYGSTLMNSGSVITLYGIKSA